ncbi:MAG: ABC transporter ATP-binding protein [Bacteroidetes bacterium]|nr:ABC transporter ATP-binding protein [Bacteroidota bacterium]
MTGNDTSIIRTHLVKKSFYSGDKASGRLDVLRGISLTVRRAEIVAIVGVSGAGKSTLLHIIGTLDRPTSGIVQYDGVDVFSLPDDELARFRNRHIGFVFQFHHLLPEFTALENVAMPALIGGEELHRVRDRAAALLHEVGLEDRAGERPPKLSGGEQQRLAVARALMNNPHVVLADEPSGNLDSENAHMLHSLIHELRRKRGQTFVLVTHNEALAQEADRVLRIADGVIHEA